MVRPGEAAQHARKALELLRATRLLFQSGMEVRAASSAYYAVFHLAEALLATAGQGAETHAGVHTLLARHFVKDGPLPSDASQRFSHLMTDRLNADYGVDRQLDEVGARRTVATAAGLAREMLAVLAARSPTGLPPELPVEADALAAATA